MLPHAGRVYDRRHAKPSVFETIFRLSLRPIDDSIEWELFRLLYTRMGLRNSWEWTVAPDVQPAQARRRADDVGFITGLDFTPDGRMLVAGSSSGSVYLFEPNSGTLCHRIQHAHEDAASRVKFVDNTYFVSGSADCSVALWDVRKTAERVNVLRGHARPITTLHYNRDSDMVVSSGQGGEVRFWYLPHFKLAAAENQDRFTPSSNYQGKLFTCQNFTRLTMNDEMLVFTNSHGTIHTIDNLDLKNLRQDLANIRFDTSIKMQLGWFKPSSSPDKRNKVRVIDHSEYVPVPNALISNIMFLEFHPHSPVLLMRLTTSIRQQLRKQVSGWSCICSVRPQMCVNSLKYWNVMSSFGSNILEEVLLFSCEETRYASFREKQASFSHCGRVIASPDKYGVRLYAFSNDLDTFDNVQFKTKHTPSGMFGFSAFWPTGPRQLATVGKLDRTENTTLCCKFSPTDMLLAVGDTNSCVSYYQPVL